MLSQKDSYQEALDKTWKGRQPLSSLKISSVVHADKILVLVKGVWLEKDDMQTW